MSPRKYAASPTVRLAQAARSVPEERNTRSPQTAIESTSAR